LLASYEAWNAELAPAQGQEGKQYIGIRRSEYIRTYGYASTFVNNDAYRSGPIWFFPPIKLARVLEPSETAFFMDDVIASSGPYWYSQVQTGWAVNPLRQLDNMVHGGVSMSVVYSDLHVYRRHRDDVPITNRDTFWDAY
jgi:hypothetical protein